MKNPSHGREDQIICNQLLDHTVAAVDDRDDRDASFLSVGILTVYSSGTAGVFPVATCCMDDRIVGRTLNKIVFWSHTHFGTQIPNSVILNKLRVKSE